MADTFKFGLVGIGNDVQLGKRGSRMVASPSGVAFMNPSGVAYIPVSVADAILDTQAVTKSQMTTAINAGLVSAVKYKGTFDASAGNYNAITNPKQGWLYKISVAGTIGGVAWEIGDNLIVNKDVTGSPTASDVDKIDNTEAADILRTSDISSNADWTQDTAKLATRGTIKTYVDTAISTAVSNAGASRTVALNFDSSSPVDIGAVVPANAKVKRAYVNVSTPFNGATESTMMIGHAGDTDSVCGTSEVDLHVAGHYEIVCNSKVGVATQYIITYARDGASAGAAEVVIEYIP